MNILEAMEVNLLSMLINTVLFAFTALLLLGRPSGGKKLWRQIRIFAGIGAAIMLTAFVATWMWKTGQFDLPLSLGETLLDYFMLLEIAVFLKAVYGEENKVCWVTAVFIDILTAFGVQISYWFVPEQGYNLAILPERLAYLFFLWVIGPVCVMAVLLLFYRAGAGRMYRQWIQYRKMRTEFVAFVSLYPVLAQALIELVHWGNMGEGNNPAVVLMLLVFIYLIFVYVSREEGQRQQIEAQNISLQQQTAYIENLEGLQKEVRRFRHDFKNMMSGMYLQVEEGDVQALQLYIQQITGDFDRQVGDQIRMMNQLANIHILEVRGLLLGKLTQMQKEEISCQLEVLRPVLKTRLRTTDLCRCLGILVDNAIEEVRGKNGGKIHIMISDQPGCTTFRVQNTLFSPVEFSRLGTLGYSTKGEGRGVGLSSYRSILARYEFALPSTTIQDGCFVQELKIINT